MKTTYTTPQESLRILMEKGCGAWKGNTRCCEELGLVLAIGGTDLIFQSRLSAYPINLGNAGNVSVAFFCKEHQAEPWKDMAPDIRERALKEQQKFKERVLDEEIPS